MGVGLYGCMDRARSWFNPCVVNAALDPSTFLRRVSSTELLCLRARWDACVLVLEVSFRDDCRPVTGIFTPPTTRVGRPVSPQIQSRGKVFASPWQQASFGISLGLETHSLVV